MKINHNHTTKSTTIVLIESEGAIRTFTGWEHLCKAKEWNAQVLRNKWSKSDKNKPIKFKGNSIQKCFDNT